MEKKKEYSHAYLEFVYFDSTDIVTASLALGEKEEDSSWDNTGWT